jgi:hypothetical protein
MRWLLFELWGLKLDLTFITIASMHDCILALGLDRGRAKWGRLFASALLASKPYKG